jgi:hypothetical protein
VDEEQEFKLIDLVVDCAKDEMTDSLLTGGNFTPGLGDGRGVGLFAGGIPVVTEAQDALIDTCSLPHHVHKNLKNRNTPEPHRNLSPAI